MLPRPDETAAGRGPSAQKATFPGAGGDLLAARLERPEAEPSAFALFAHCFTCGKDVKAAGAISRALCAQGIAVLRFDFTGLGSSEGDFANTNFSSNVQDLLAAARYLEERWQPPRLLIGHSLGGAAVLAAAGRMPSAAGVATVGAPSEPAHLRKLIRDVDTIEREGEAEVVIAVRPFRIKRQFLEDIERQRMRDVIGALRRPIMILHSPRDEIVDIEEAGQIFKAARHPKSFVSLDDADHLLSAKGDAEYVARILAAWGSRYI